MEIGQRGGLAFEQGGQGDSLLVLVHGLAATARVWAPMLDQAARRWPGRWIAPDLRGHGASPPAGGYAVQDYAADIAELIGQSGATSVTIIGHSLGGVIAIALAGGDRIRPRSIFGLGIKVDWADEELERMSALATKSPRLFDFEADALAQHRRQCGLECDLGSPLLERGIVRQDGQWRTAFDQAAFAVEAPQMKALTDAASCPVHLACGEQDRMVSVDRLRSFDPGAACIVGARHNAMVEDPDAIWDWMDRLL